jgi:hypothetical protein
MPNVYNRKAREMAAAARKAPTPELREEYLRLQEAWLKMAETAESLKKQNVRSRDQD